ncbi:hypothetical protein Gotri_006212 [Gossypium trilobum]|uniref:DUF4283 domain-containing protein n=1 Tax=Gossypium trilobum TaxID=34281 RepID=A0A7J9EZK8_9ROSI|nr:hypothetical protein [Gossypium trilobum]
MEEELANLNIVDKKKESVLAQGNEEVIEEDYSLFLVGRVLIDSVVHFPSMRNALADLWHPLGGLEKGEDQLQVPLIYVIYWVQVYNLPFSFMSEGVARQFGSFIGQFLEYDVALVTKGVKKFMHISLIAPPTRAASAASRWLRDNFGDRRLGSDEVKGVDLRMEEMPIEFVDGKKRQWARVSWLQMGDCNTTFFHSFTSSRKRRNFVRGLKDRSGDWLVGKWLDLQ